MDETAGDPVKIDGEVTAEEMAASWKSGAFRQHLPGNPPPEANPHTYCFVTKTEVNKKPCLYISFICKDPDVNKIITRHGNQSDLIINDDSVEIFLDTNYDHRDYYQLIVNAKGVYWSAYYPKPAFDGDMSKPIDVRRWNVSPTIRSIINREAGQWTCEILIPFDQLGGVPAKGSRWGVNFCRNYRGQGENWQLQTWFSVYGSRRNFHNPRLFGMFEW